MEIQIKVVFDLVAGVLAGLQVIVPKNVYKSIDDYLLGYLSERPTLKGRVLWPSILVAIFLTLGIILAVIFKSVSIDINNGRIHETIFLFVGLIAGILVIAMITRYYRKLLALKDLTPTSVAVTTGAVLGFLSIIGFFLFAGGGAVNLISFLAAFAVSSMILGICIGLMPIARWFFTFQNDVLLRLGVILFVIARIIELHNP